MEPHCERNCEGRYAPSAAAVTSARAIHPEPEAAGPKRLDFRAPKVLGIEATQKRAYKQNHTNSLVCRKALSSGLCAGFDTAKGIAALFNNGLDGSACPTGLEGLPGNAAFYFGLEVIAVVLLADYLCEQPSFPL
jgi:hypothetical protein